MSFFIYKSVSSYNNDEYIDIYYSVVVYTPNYG